MPAGWNIEPGRNIIAGLQATLVTLPLAMGLGALAFSPFGPAYLTTGVVAGLYAAAFLGLIALLAGARGITIYAPRSLVSFMIAAVFAKELVGASWLPAGDPAAVSSAVLLLLAMAGAFQFLLGLLHLARLVKFIPTPVMAGFQNAAAIIILYSQLPMLLGLPSHPALGQWMGALAGIQPLNMAVAAATLALIYLAPRLVRNAPPLMLGLLGGTLLHYLLAWAGLSAHLGGTVGSIPLSLPDGSQLAGIMALTVLPGFTDALPGMIAAAASVAIVASLDALINAKVVENLSGQRGNSTRELLCVGAANSLTPLLGGIIGSISLSSSTVNLGAGARNSLSLLAHALVFLCVVPLLAPLLGRVPNVVLAALLAQAGWQLFDRWTLQLLGKAASGSAVNQASIVGDLAVIALVTAIALAGEVVIAVALGMGIALVVFALRMSRGVVRSWRNGDELHSRRTRTADDAALLQAHGRSTLMMELEGPMFFASAEQLHNRIDAAIADKVRYVVLDISRVNEVDSTGARILKQTWQRVRAAGAELLICGQDDHHQTGSMLRDHGVSEILGPDRVHPDLDRALEWCENDLLALLKTTDSTGDIAFDTLDVVRGLTPGECGILREALRSVEFRPQETVFSEGSSGDALYIIVRGSASVRLKRRTATQSSPGNPDSLRLVTFSAGTVFGEMALLDREPRSATVTADEALVCYMLDQHSFERLAAAHPSIGMALLANLGRALSLRLRETNRTLGQGS
jgi:anti-anti-sigma factor